MAKKTDNPAAKFPRPVQLEELTDQELQERLEGLRQQEQSLKAERTRRANEQLKEHHQLVLKHVRTLLEFVPYHADARLKDDDACTDYACQRCCLLGILNCDYNDEVVVQVTVRQQQVE